jgi:hypothetical protein
VLIDEHPADVLESVACDQNHPEQSWCVRVCGVGVMINASEFGSADTGAIEEVEFLARGE